MSDDMFDRSDAEELQYIKYSAKELLFEQGKRLDALAAAVNDIQANMVTRAQLTSTRRWAFTATAGAVGAIATVLRQFGV